ncbi:hypothetical protein EYF80_034986 [Liparis tanakae]|uniref:Uncharacterized protein n=1 Tax=Liparis tanakae TaxID=230148 RepID=A0A4Z2GNI7_9TELE|nr:hypothetical protein EYF80_034986 [Liparis tanakae]
MTLEKYKPVLRQVREDRFRGHQAVPLPQDPHHHLAATHLRQAQLGGPGRLLLRHAPTQLHLLQVEAVRGGAAPELREHGAHQDVALRVHVSEGGGDEDADASPPEDGGEEWAVK